MVSFLGDRVIGVLIIIPPSINENTLEYTHDFSVILVPLNRSIKICWPNYGLAKYLMKLGKNEAAADLLLNCSSENLS